MEIKRGYGDDGFFISAVIENPRRGIATNMLDVFLE